MTIKKLLAVLALLVLVAVGCGGDDGGSGDDEGSSEDRSDEPTEEEGLSEEDYAEEVSDLCSDWWSEALDSDASLREIAEELEGTTEDLAAEIADIEAPEDLADDVEEVDETLGDYSEFMGELAEGLAESEAQFEGSVVTGLGFEEQDQVTAAHADLADAFEGVDADCGFDEAESELGPFEGDSGDTSSDFSDDFSSDFSDDPTSTTTPVLGEPQDPSSYIEEYGTMPEFDALAEECFGGDLAACDELFQSTPVSESQFSYEGYGNTCGGRLEQEYSGSCVDL